MIRLADVIAKYRRMYEATRPKLGRWTYCKYCYKSVRPAVGPDYSVVVCTVCGYGLAPMREVCEAGSLEAFQTNIREWFFNQNAKPA